MAGKLDGWFGYFRRTGVRGCLALLSTCTLAGCFAYVPAAADALAQGTAVRARLAPPGDFRLIDITANNVVLVRGEMIRADPDSLLLSATWLESSSGFDYPAGGVTLRFPLGQVATLERKQLSTIRTALLLGGAALLAVAARFGFEELGGGSSNGGGPTPQ